MYLKISVQNNPSYYGIISEQQKIVINSLVYKFLQDIYASDMQQLEVYCCVVVA